MLLLEQNGVQAVRRLREGGYGNLVVGVTGNVLEHDVTEYLASGVDMIMSKPVKMSLLGMLLRHVKEHGFLSQPDMKLSEDTRTGQLVWKKRN